MGATCIQPTRGFGVVAQVVHKKGETMRMTYGEEILRQQEARIEGKNTESVSCEKIIERLMEEA